MIYTDSIQKDSINADASFYLTINGQKDQTQKLYLKDSIVSDKKSLYKKDEKAEFEFKAIDVGKVRRLKFSNKFLVFYFDLIQITKILLGHDDNQQDFVWHVANITIKRGNDITP